MTFFDMFGVWGALWTYLVPWRVHGADIGEMILSMGALFAPFWLPFLMKIVSFFMCFLIAFLDAFLWFFNDFGSVF